MDAEPLIGRRRRNGRPKRSGPKAKGRVMSRKTTAALVLCVIMGWLGPAAFAADAAPEPPPGTGAADWRSLPPKDLTWMARNLTGDSETARQARVQLADHITVTYLASPAATKQVLCQEWRCFAECLAKDLADATRQQWVTGITSAYASGAEAVKLLQLAEIRDLAAALAQLGAADKAADLVAQGLSGRTWKPDDLVSLADVLAGLKEAGKAARQQLAKTVTDTQLASISAVRSFSGRNWAKVTGVVRGDLSADVRAVWTARLREGFDADTVAALKYDDVAAVGDALGSLGAPLANDILLPYVERSAEWRSFMPAKLASLAGRLNSLDDVAAKAQLALAKHIMTTCLGSRETVRSVGLETWQTLTRTGRNLPVESRQAWATAVKEAFVPDPQALLQMKAADLVRLSDTILVLDKDQGQGLAYSWLTGSDLARSTAQNALLPIVSRAVAYEREAREKRQALLESLEPIMTPQGDQASQFKQCVAVTQLWNSLGDVFKAQGWVEKAYAIALGSEEARASVGIEELQWLSSRLYHLEMITSGKEFPGLAAAVARHARQGTLTSRGAMEMAAVLTTPAARQQVRGELLDAAGCPRFAVAQLLAWAYRQAGELPAWRSFVDGQVAAASDADARALWTMAKACTEELVPTEPAPGLRLRYLKAALACAQAEALRFTVLTEIVSFFKDRRGRLDAVELIESVKGQFGPERAARMVDLQEILRREHAGFVAGEAKRQAAEARGGDQARLGYYRHCLDQARAQGNASTAARLEAAIQQLEKNLNP